MDTATVRHGCPVSLVDNCPLFGERCAFSLSSRRFLSRFGDFFRPLSPLSSIELNALVVVLDGYLPQSSGQRGLASYGFGHCVEVSVQHRLDADGHLR